MNNIQSLIYCAFVLFMFCYSTVSVVVVVAVITDQTLPEHFYWMLGQYINVVSAYTAVLIKRFKERFGCANEKVSVCQ